MCQSFIVIQAFDMTSWHVRNFFLELVLHQDVQ